MKTLYLIGGTMGVGKTYACRALQQLLPIFLHYISGESAYVRFYPQSLPFLYYRLPEDWHRTDKL